MLPLASSASGEVPAERFLTDFRRLDQAHDVGFGIRMLLLIDLNVGYVARRSIWNEDHEGAV